MIQWIKNLFNGKKQIKIKTAKLQLTKALGIEYEEKYKESKTS